MTARAWNRAETLDPAGGPLPQALDVLLARAPDERAPAFLLLAGRRAHRSGWAVRAATRIAEAVMASGGEVTLVDAAMTDPRLHRELSASNGEGIADVMLFGASPEHVSTPTAMGFAFIAAGSSAGDPEAVLTAGGWARVIPALTAWGRVLLVYALADAPGADSLATRFDGVVALAERREIDAVLAVLPEAVHVNGVVCPPEEAGEPVEAGAGRVDGVSVDAEEGPAPELAGVGKDEEQVVEQAGSGPRTARRGRSSNRVLVLRNLLIAVLFVVAGWLVWDRLGPMITNGGVGANGGAISAPAASASESSPSSGRGTPDAARASALSALPAPAIAGRPSGQPLPYSVAIESHPNGDVAMQRVRALARRDSSTEFFVSPVTLDSSVYYRVMAGPLADSASAATLMKALVREGAKTTADAWSIRPTPYSFLVGDYPTRAAALALRDSLARERIPTYIVPEPYSSGVLAYRVYAGAFEGPSLSVTMAEMLRKAGISPNLVRRTGRPPA